MPKVWRRTLYAEVSNYSTDSEHGFALLELAVVVVVIGALSAIAIPVLHSINFQAERARLESAVANSAKIVHVGHASEHDPSRIEAEVISFIGTTAATSDLLSNLADRGMFCVELTESGVGTARSGPGCAEPLWNDE